MPKGRYLRTPEHKATHSGWHHTAESRRRMSVKQAKYLGDSRLDRGLRRKYGITEAEYNEMLVSQKGVCKLCGKSESIKSDTPRQRGKERKLAVDHDHKTGKVRGLLCYRCNLDLGLYEKYRDTRKYDEYLNLNKSSTDYTI